MTASSRTQQARTDPLPSGAAQLNHIGDGLPVCFQTPRVCCQTRRRRNRLLLICHHIIDCDKGGEYPRPWFATASDLLWYAACYEHPYSSPYPQCDSGFVCCQTVCLTVAIPSVVECVLRKKPMTEPPFICLFPDRLLVCCQTLGVCCQTLRWRSQPFVCLLLLVKLITKREMNISAQSLRLPWTRPGMLHVMDTHTHHRIYSGTVDYASPPCSYFPGKTRTQTNCE